MSDDQPVLWCCHVRGPDELIPCESYEAARKQADELNYHFAPTKWHKPHEFDPSIIAAPMVWPHDAKSHAEGLEQKKPPSGRETLSDDGAPAEN